MASKAANNLSILVYPRIHITLLSLTSESYRKNGGLGFAVNEPPLELRITEDTANTAVDNRLVPLSSAELLELKELANRVHAAGGYKRKARIEILGDKFLSHVGLGAGTAIRLAIVEGLSLLNEEAKTERKLVSQSGRGGTSGVGVHTYFDGGYTFDLGRAADLEGFQSSDGAREGFSPPLELSSVRMPSWRIGLCFPNLPAPSFEVERDLFNRNCPLPISSSALATFHSLFGVHASILESDYYCFCQAINAIQTTEWKKAEWEIHDRSIENVRAFLTSNGADCVGLSSLGPTMFFLSRDIESLIAKAKRNIGDQAEFLEV